MTEIGLKNVENVQIFPSQCFTWLLCQYFFFFFFPCFEFGLLEAQIHCFALNQLRAETGWLVTYLIPVPHVGLVYDVTGIYCWTQNGSTHRRGLTTFKLRFLTKRTRNIEWTERERERDRQTDRDRQRQTETDRDRDRERQRQRQTDRETETERQRQRETETERQRERFFL